MGFSLQNWTLNSPNFVLLRSVHFLEIKKDVQLQSCVVYLVLIPGNVVILAGWVLANCQVPSTVMITVIRRESVVIEEPNHIHGPGHDNVDYEQDHGVRTHFFTGRAISRLKNEMVLLNRKLRPTFNLPLAISVSWCGFTTLYTFDRSSTLCLWIAMSKYIHFYGYFDIVIWYIYIYIFPSN